VPRRSAASRERDAVAARADERHAHADPSQQARRGQARRDDDAIGELLARRRLERDRAVLPGEAGQLAAFPDLDPVRAEALGEPGRQLFRANEAVDLRMQSGDDTACVQCGLEQGGAP